MKIYVCLIALITIMFLFIFCSSCTVEGFGGRRSRGGGHKGMGRLIDFKRRGNINRTGSSGRTNSSGRTSSSGGTFAHNRSQRHNTHNHKFINRSSGYLNRFRRRNNGWYSSSLGNNYLYNYWDNYAPSWYDYWWNPPCNCKRGCTPEGCSYPGNGVEDCVWATDCDCCGF